MNNFQKWLLNETDTWDDYRKKDFVCDNCIGCGYCPLSNIGTEEQRCIEKFRVWANEEAE